ncbi:MAG: 2-amino-4-hydroxy-6-hydroxymethyldihydropteridine diphosphokinase [Lachnospiraceae bacterium]
MKQWDCIKIENLTLFCNHGVYAEENTLGQKFIISAEMLLDTRKAGETDDLTASVHYGMVCECMKRVMEQNTFQLIERAAEVVARTVLLEYPLIHRITVEVKKPWAPIKLPLEQVSVCITRGWHTVYLGLGSNMGDKKAYLDQAIVALSEQPEIRVGQVATYIETEPYGGVEQDFFLNTCLEIETLLTPEQLLEKTMAIEQQAGRERIVHWGPRTLDIDILFYDDWIVNQPDLTIPHKEVHLREFVLAPMCEIAPNLIHPVRGKSITELLETLKKE